MEANLLNDMMLFAKVVDCKSFSKAAKQLKLSNSVVSKRITRLEQVLGVRLLNRTTRKLSLTEAGTVFYERCSRISEEVDDAKLAVAYTHKTPQGWIRVNAPFSFGYSHMAPAVAEFMSKYPKVKVDLHLSIHPMDLIEEGFDLGIRIGELEDSSLIARRLTDRRMRLCGSPSYLKQHGVPQTPDELANHNCLMYEHFARGEEWHFNVNGKDKEIKVKGNLMSNNGRALIEAAVSGLGLVFLPGFMVTPQIKVGTLISILNDYCPHGIGIHAVYPHNRYLATKVRSFIDFLIEKFSDDAYWEEPENITDIE